MLDKLLDDLRFPIGLLFLIFSLVLVPLGLFNSPAEGELNLNLSSGLFMGAFAVFMLGGACLAARRKPGEKN